MAPLAWARDVNPQEFQQIQSIARHFAGGDTVEGLKSLLAEARKDPKVDAALNSMAAQTLASLRGRPQAAQPEQEPQPDLPIQLEDGRVVHLYSAEQQAKREAFLQQRWMQGVEQKLQPLQQTHEQLQAERAALKQEQQIKSFVDTTFSDAATWPGMENVENQRAVGEYLKALKLTSDDPREVEILLNQAYRKVVLPKLQASGQSALLDSLKTKAAAASSVNPGSAGASAARSPRSFHDASLQW
jgi:hypothetical protein